MKKITLTNVNVLDGTKNMQLLKEVNVEITDNVITNIGNFNFDKKSKVIDLNGKYLTPGLINLHAHLPSSGKLSKQKLGDKSKLVKFVTKNPIGKLIGNALDKKYALMAMNSGVTTVRAVGGVGKLDSILRDKINAGKILGPRLIVCNSAIGVKGGHMDGTVAVSASSVEEAVNLVKELKNQKVDLVKLMITGGVLDGKEAGHPAPLRMPKEMVEACVKQAHELGLKVCAHIESKEGMEVAINAGVDSLEHGSVFDVKLVKDMKMRNQAVVTTLSPAIPFFEIDPDIIGYGEIAKINSKIVFDGMVECSKLALENNIPVGLGTDAGSTLVAHYNFYKELILFEKYCGITREFAIYSATLGNATIAGIGEKTGSIEVGKEADLLVLDSNPLDDLEAFRKPSMIFVRGNLIKNPKVKRDKTIDSLVDPII